jgi:hypothetical protein
MLSMRVTEHVELKPLHGAIPDITTSKDNNVRDLLDLGKQCPYLRRKMHRRQSAGV